MKDFFKIFLTVLPGMTLLGYLSLGSLGLWKMVLCGLVLFSGGVVYGLWDDKLRTAIHILRQSR